MWASPTLLLLSTVAASWVGEPDPINPRTYASPSGRYHLRVDPTHPAAAGPAHYRLTRAGKTLWSKRLPFTFLGADVTDDGRAAGYAYRHGARGYGPRQGPNALDIAALARDGSLLLHETYPVPPEDGPHRADPIVVGVLADGAADRMIVRVDVPDTPDNEEDWWTYQLSTGRRTDVLRPPPPVSWSSDHLISAGFVRDTSLVLVGWWRRQGDKTGAAFTLLDAQAKPVWRLDLPEDYEQVPENDEGQRVFAELLTEGAVLRRNASRRFDLWFVRESRRVTFKAARKPEGWTVREVARKPYVLPRPTPPKPVPFPPVSLKPLGKLVLPVIQNAEDGTRKPPPSRSALTEVASLYVNPAGRVYAVDKHNGSVHVFDHRGRRQFVALPPASSLTDNSPHFLDLQVTRSGDIYLSSMILVADAYLSTRGNGYRRFSPRGKLLGHQPFERYAYEGPPPPVSVRPTWRWRGPALLDERSRLVTLVNRWPNGDWMASGLVHLRGPAAVAPDGRLMAFEATWNRLNERLAFYSPTGRPLKMVPLPPGIETFARAAYDGSTAYFTHSSGNILAVSPAGKPLWRFRPPGPTADWKPFPSCGGLALYDGEATILWFAKPPSC